MSQNKDMNVTKGATPSLLESAQGGEVINRVQSSGLVTLNLEDYYVPGERVFLDIKPMLFQELILREKEFRAALKATQWAVYQNKHVALGCTADAIIPTWAYMLVAIHLEPVAKTVFFGSLADMEAQLFRKSLLNMNWEEFRGSKVVVKGCSKVTVPDAVYVEVTTQLKSVAFSIMFGEPCSTVPIFKAPRA